MRYLLLGCSVVSKEPETTWFDIDPERLEEIRAQALSIRHLTNLNWAIQFSHNPEQAVLLPYREYLAYVKDNPEACKIREKGISITDIKAVGREYI